MLLPASVDLYCIRLSIVQAAVSCSAVMARFHWAGIWVWDDRQAGPCMGPVHGWCMGRCTVLVGWEGAWCIASFLI